MLHISLKQIYKNNAIDDPYLQFSSADTFNSHNFNKFIQVVRIFGDSPLSSITPGECDYAFNCLLRDKELHATHKLFWNTLAKCLCDTIQLLTTNLPINNAYKKEYCRFMNEREKYRNYHDDIPQVLTLYNTNVIQWRFPK